MIKLRDIEFRYPNSDFHLGFDKLQFEQGSKTAIIGPSGFGKTTLLNLISGISLPQHGEVVVGDTHITTLSDSARRTFRLVNIGFVFQDFKLLNYLKVMDNILLPYRINNAQILYEKIRLRAKEVAELLNIQDKLQKYPEKLSQGERQRVAICRAILNDPQIILADEPTGNLDPENKQRIMDILYNYVQERQSTLITVTHDHELLSDFDMIIDFKELLAIHQ